MNTETRPLIISLAIAIPILIVQATWIFLDARKRGEGYYWLWGFLGLIQFPTAIIVYLLATRTGKIKCKNCGQLAGRNSKVCPNCGKALNKTCRNCGAIVNEKWAYCPKCSNKLKEG